MQVKIILVEPEYEENIGLIARVMKNFSCNELLIVNAKARHYSAKARSRAMHAQEILKNAKKFSSLEKALKQADYSVATSSQTTPVKKMFRNALNVKQFSKNFSKTNCCIGIVFGRESTGLTNEEINECDFLLKIPTNYKYRALNLSHSAAIILYELFCSEEKGRLKTAEREKKQLLLKRFEELLQDCKGIENKKAAKSSFKALLGRAIITEKEANALLSVFSEAKNFSKKNS